MPKQPGTALTMDLANIQEMAADAASRRSPGAAPCSRERRPPIRGFGGLGRLGFPAGWGDVLRERGRFLGESDLICKMPKGF